jgi:hypothetical protein
VNGCPIYSVAISLGMLWFCKVSFRIDLNIPELLDWFLVVAVVLLGLLFYHCLPEFPSSIFPYNHPMCKSSMRKMAPIEEI